MNSAHCWHPLPAEVCALVERTPATVLLSCADPRLTGQSPQSNAESCTRLFVSPRRICRVEEPAQLPGLFSAIEEAVAAGRFAAGFFAYECGQCFEPTASMAPRRPGQPLAWIAIYDRCFAFDHRSGQFAGGPPPALAELSSRERPHAPEPLHAAFCLSQPQYSTRIAALHDWIRAGDIYQLNFTAPFHLRAAAQPARLYAQLCRSQPVEYGAFVHWQPGSHILSFSPELFFRIEPLGASRRITTRPMKGTAHRGRTSREDQAIAEWLRNDAKNRAENVMIVDLLRNDLGRLCRFGSVAVENLFQVERYRTLWQMTSTVTGELRPEVDFHAVFRALFPCGSVTGAPKIRAMQLIAGLEGEPRGVYTGSIGFFSRQRTVFNVAIRTLELEGGQGRMGVGSGIVIDSDAGDEFRECLLKAAFFTQHQEPFSLIETMLWRGGYPLIELHLDRLADSAGYFDFSCDRAAAKEALEAHAAGFGDPRPRKVRLLLDSDGAVHIQSEPLDEDPEPAARPPARVCIAAPRTDPADPFLFHKTTHRAHYAEAFSAASAAGFADALFFNTRGELTEGAISNVLVEKAGRWFTPPVECGLLAGVYRRHLLQTMPGIEERRLYLDDLRHADAVYLCNAVRGLRRVLVQWENKPSPFNSSP